MVMAASIRPSVFISEVNHPEAINGQFHGRDVAHLPPEILTNIFSNLSFSDISACRLVSNRWKNIIDGRHLQARAFHRYCHPQGSSHDRQNTIDRYHSFTRHWLESFNDHGKKFVAQLDKLLDHKHFPELLFFSTAKALAVEEVFSCKNISVIKHSHWLKSICFSPDGNGLHR